ncbi:MAG TPA: DUF4157 domain-containing protein [Pyrinomonadaceae bacterium]|nr:DUF4157 domain-containing protein [Pyrinomonadaceae bacterium]
MKNRNPVHKLEKSATRQRPSVSVAPVSLRLRQQTHPLVAFRHAAAMHAARLSSDEILTLQGTIGNHRVSQLLKNPFKEQEVATKDTAEHSTNSSSLPSKLREKMEAFFADDFSNVRIHTNTPALRPGTIAYTKGNDIHFARGRYNAHSQEGQELIGHELTHVVQQRQGRTRKSVRHKDLAISEEQSLEAEADAYGRQAARGLPRPARVSLEARPTQNTQTNGTIQEKNQFWHGHPDSTSVDSPIFTIANEVASDLAINPSDVLKHLGTTLNIAKTYQKELIKSSYQKIERPDKADAWLDTPPPKKGGRTDPIWISAYGNLGKVEDQIKGDPIKPYNGGHLIAWEFLDDAANVKGNIAPQAEDQNQALFRRLENTLTESLKNGVQGIEVTVKTPYNDDNYTVTYQDLITRKLITDPTWISSLNAKLTKAITLKQMAPDYYALDLLTQIGQTSIATVDARQQRNAIDTHKLVRTHTEDINRFIQTQKPKPLSIISTAVNPSSTTEDPSAYARYIYLNYRTSPGYIPPTTATTTTPTITVPPKVPSKVPSSYQKKMLNLAFVIGIISALVYSFGVPFNEAIEMVLYYLSALYNPVTEGADKP